MNFLNKKHVQSFPNTMSHFASNQSSSSKPIHIAEQQNLHQTGTYISNRLQHKKINQVKQSPTKKFYPSGSTSHLKNEPQQPTSSYSQSFALRQSPSTLQISPANLCPQHQSQLLRHLCLQCNQLLCSQCISDHLENHRQTTNTIPKIATINKLRKDMNLKAQKILQFMEENNPKMILNDVNQLKFQAINKIHEMKTEVIRVFQQWCKELETHVFEDLIKTDELEGLAGEMGKIKEEVLGLYNDMLGQQNPNVETVKKVHQIDSEKLEAAYLEMFNKFSKSVLKSKFTFQYNWEYLMESFDKSLVLRPLHPQVSSPIYQHKPDLSDIPAKVERVERKSSKEQLTYLASPVVTTKIGDEDDKKFIEIQSIESLVQMGQVGSIGERGTVQSSGQIPSDKELGQGQKVERSFSRQGSVKRLSIFNAQEQPKPTQNMQNHLTE